MAEIKKYDLLEWLIDVEIDKAYQARRNKRKTKTKFSASNAGYCKRATILNRLNAEEEEHTENQKWIFWLGQIIHEAIENLVKGSGKVVACETFLSGHDFIHGAIDVIVRDDNGLNVLYSIKSINPGSFWRYIVKEKRPHKHNIYQEITYFIINNKYPIDKVKILYIAKDLDYKGRRSFWIDVTPELVQEVTDWWDSVKESFDNRLLPEPYAIDSAEYKHFCKGCTFSNLWCFGDQQTIDNNIQSLVWPTNEKTEKTADVKCQNQ